MPLAAFMPVAQEFEHVRVGFAALDEATVEVFRDCFRDFRIDVQVEQVDARSAAVVPMDACVMRLDAPGAADLLRALRGSHLRQRCVIFAVGSTEDAARHAQFGINALVERLTARDISSAIRNTYLLLVHRLRRYVRIPLVVPVMVSTEDGEVRGVTRDISAGGLNISGESGIDLGRKVKATFTLPSDMELEVDGMICWGAGTAFGIALFNSNRQAKLRAWTEEYLLAGEPAEQPQP